MAYGIQDWLADHVHPQNYHERYIQYGRELPDTDMQSHRGCLRRMRAVLLNNIFLFFKVEHVYKLIFAKTLNFFSVVHCF